MKKNHEQFEYLQLELPTIYAAPPKDYKKVEDEENNRGVIIIDCLNSNNETINFLK